MGFFGIRIGSQVLHGVNFSPDLEIPLPICPRMIGVIRTVSLVTLPPFLRFCKEQE